MPWEPPVTERESRRARIGQWVTFALAVLLVALLAYLSYVGYVGSERLTAAPTPSSACGTPLDLGIAYEAIGYPQAADEQLAVYPDHAACPEQGPAADDTLRTTDGVRLAGWYIPAEDGIGPTGPTVVLVHGWGSNKSELLDQVALLAPSYNVVAFDLRHHGQSSPDRPTTQGLTEQRDLDTVLNWLAAHKGPTRIALFGISMGGATATGVAGTDERVNALILDSTHATLQAAVQARLDEAGYPLSLPGSWGILMGGLLRTGLDMTSADPDRAITRLGDRPVLVLVGGADDSIGDDPGGRLKAAGEKAGVSVTVETCPAAGHAELLQTCPDEYRAWVLGFLDSALGG